VSPPGHPAVVNVMQSMDSCMLVRAGVAVAATAVKHVARMSPRGC
jgi:hypothetical protein